MSFDVYGIAYCEEDELALESTLFELPERRRPNDLITFTVYRRGDISENHDENQMNDPHEPQYFGIVFPSGKCVINWNTAIKSVSVFDSYADMIKIHGHLDSHYLTDIVWG